MSNKLSRRLWIIAVAMLCLAATANKPVIDPALGVPGVFCFRITHIDADKSDAQGDRFIFLFEALNWSNKPVRGITIMLNEGVGFGGVSGAAPFFSNAAIDANGRPIGAQTDPPPGNLNPPNNWATPSLTRSRIRWQAGPSGTSIPFIDLVTPGLSSICEACDLVPGCVSDLGDGCLGVSIPNPETIDDTVNVLDGFQFTVDDFDAGEILSFNWFLSDAAENPIGTAGVGNPFGFGTVNLARVDDGPFPGPLFEGNTGFSQSATFFYDSVYVVPDPATYAGEFGAGITATFLDPADNIFNAAVNTRLISVPIRCEVDITSPPDNALVCGNSATVKGVTHIRGGVPPFTVSCQVNGVAASIADTFFTATVPVSSGKNFIVAACTVVDGNGQQSVCFDTTRVTVIIDKTPPTCSFTPGYKSVTGTFFDNESGIAKIEPLFLFNAKLTVDPFVPGDKKVNFRLDDRGLESYLGFDIKITDLCGNTHVCDPVMSHLSTDQENRQHVFKFRQVDRYLIVTNLGLSEVRVDLNGHRFDLYSETSRGARSLNAYRMPREGKITIDLQPYLREGENIMRVEIAGPAGAGADLILIDEAHEIDQTLELQPVPTEFQLLQNYPNPFNPTTTIRFGIPARAAEGTRVQLRIYNTLGVLVRTLVDEKMFPGNYAMDWNGRDVRGVPVSSGIYIYQLETGAFKATKRMIMLK